MDANNKKDRLAAAKKIQKDIIFANRQIKNLSNRTPENESALVKYRQNFTVPAVWIPQQGVRVSNIPMIPAEKIQELDRYITINTTRIDGGDLDSKV